MNLWRTKGLEAEGMGLSDCKFVSAWEVVVYDVNCFSSNSLRRRLSSQA